MPETSREIRVGPRRAIQASLIVPEISDGPVVIVLPGAHADPSGPREFPQLLYANGFTVCLPLRDMGETEAAEDPAGLKQNLEDLGHLIDHSKNLPEANGRVAVVGFGMAGTLAYLSAARLTPDAAVIYQGTGIVNYLDEGRHIDCPTVFHMGVQDPEIAGEVDHKIHAALIGKFNIAIYKYETGRAFADEHDPVHYDKVAADKAHERTLKHLSQLA